MIKSVINIEASSQHVFGILTDYAGYKNWIPGCEKCVVTSQSGNSTNADIIVNSTRRIELGLRFDAQPPHSLRFKMTRGKDLKAYAGTYRLMQAADGKGTVVIAELEVDAGFMVPKFMVDNISRKMIDDTGAALRKHAMATRSATTLMASAVRVSVPAKPRRAKRIVKLTKTSAGYNLWILGQTLTIDQ